MRPAPQLAVALRERGNRITIEADGRLAIVDGEPLTDELRGAIRAHRDALLEFLATESELFEERAAIREYDARLSRPLAERLARRDVAEWFNPPDLPAVTLAHVAALFDAERVAGEAMVLTSDEEQVALVRGGVR